MTNHGNYQQEWSQLHRSYDQYETLAVIIKLSSIALFFFSFTISIQPLVMIVVLLTLWLQEGILKTFQSRTEQRLLSIEKKLLHDETQHAFQFYSEWEAKRPNTINLIKGYMAQSLRPTVAFPYIVLVAVLMFQLIP